MVECEEMEFIMNNKGEETERPARRRVSDTKQVKPGLSIRNFLMLNDEEIDSSSISYQV